ncbi:musculoskeletal embryonic nuclear protein 1b isoform X2 [Entelurus aequoreus]|uniref:musculoskeletal embryonic nuclear protein 1b isoform X2 n=1 Tax=Entelurus aequoreus TaxID=161455 RepID=UPI002B1E89AA|nr:musculoskeletal embryonic nuclear protein 1b isoform X2 [Entelurus aequoreus]
MSQKRTYPSGAEKRKKKKVEEEKKCHDKGALLKYFGGTESAQSQSTSSGSTVSDESATSTTTSPSHHGPSSAPPVDPAEWPSFLSDSDRTEQVIRGPLSIKENFSFPKRHDGRSFHYHYTYRQLVNGEKVKRSWLTYSRSKDAVYCFCCKLFSKKSLKLAAEGQRDWVNIGAMLKQHENSEDHCSNMVKWKEFALRLSKGKTIDEFNFSSLRTK